MGCRKTNRTSSNHCDLERDFLLAASFIDVDRSLRFGAVLLGEKSLQGADRDRLIDFATTAGGLARMRTNSSADAGQRIWIARQPVGFFKTSFGNQADVATGIRVGRACHHAGKVCV